MGARRHEDLPLVSLHVHGNLTAHAKNLDTEVKMLVLTRKKGERIRIGPDIFVTIVRIGSRAVRVGIEAPEATGIVRDELPLEDEARNRVDKSGAQAQDSGRE